MVHRFLQPLFIFSFAFLGCIPSFQVLAQAIPVTQIRAFDLGDETQLLEVPIYGNSIVNLNRTEQKVEVFDLNGNPHFSVNYSINLAIHLNRPVEFIFIGEPDLRNADEAELMMIMYDVDLNLILRRFNESGDLLYEELVSASLFPSVFRYFYVDPITQHGFFAVDLFQRRSDSVVVYPFSGATESIRLRGELALNKTSYPSIPLLINENEDSLLVGYNVFGEEIARMEPKFGADRLIALETDFRHDGVLDAYSPIDTIIDGEEASRVIWYDNT